MLLLLWWWINFHGNCNSSSSFKFNNLTFFPDTFHSSSSTLTEDIRLLHHEMVRFRMHQLKASNESWTNAMSIPGCLVSSCSWLQAEGVVSASWSWFHCCFICSCTWRGRQNGKLLQFVSVNIHSLLSTSSSCPRNTIWGWHLQLKASSLCFLLLSPTSQQPLPRTPDIPTHHRINVLFSLTNINACLFPVSVKRISYQRRCHCQSSLLGSV